MVVCTYSVSTQGAKEGGLKTKGQPHFYIETLFIRGEKEERGRKRRMKRKDLVNKRAVSEGEGHMNA